MRAKAVIVIVAIVAIVLLALAVDYIPARTRTVNTLLSIGVRMNIYIQTHGAMPSSFALLPNREGYGNDIMDSWGHPIQFAYDEKKRNVCLTSYGRDGKPGGKGTDADIVVTVPLNDDGTLRMVEFKIHYSDEH